jgi:PAS domain-containing protein
MATPIGAAVTGQILIDHDFGAGGEQYQFSIPMRSVDTLGTTATVLWILSLDMDVLTGLWIPAALCLVLCVILGVVVYFFYDQEVKQQLEQEKLMKNVSLVLEEATTGFAWLDENSEFRFANAALLGLLGYSSLAELQTTKSGIRRKWTDLLPVLEEQEAYAARLERSRRGEATGKYWCTIATQSGEWRRALIHGERMPFGGVWRGKSPHRFGVVLRWLSELADEPPDESPADA